MANTIWPILWREGATEGQGQADIDRAELLAANTLRMLTLYRVGGNPVTVIPERRQRVWGRLDALGRFYPNFLPDLHYRGDMHHAIQLPMPVGRVDKVTIRGEELTPLAYRVEDGQYLVRLDGEAWPVGSDDFTVTYLNAYEVDGLGEFVGGVLAEEFLQAVTGGKKCRLPSNVTNVTRQGVSYELASGMFPEGTTGINEVDTYIMQWNPHGLRTRPGVYSPDLPKARQTTWP